MITIKIIDPEGIEREVLSMKTLMHDRKSVIDGEKVSSEKYVEVEILGNNRRWKTFYKYDDFKKNNPEVKI